MNSYILKYCLCILLVGLCSISWGIDIPHSGVDEYTLGYDDSVMVYNVRDSNGNYLVQCSGGLRIVNAESATLYVRGICLCENENDYMEIYDGWDSEGQLVGRFSGMDSIVDVMCYSGTMYIKFHSDYDIVDSGVEILVGVCPIVEEIYNFMYSQLSDSEVNLMWQDSRQTTEWKVIVRSELTGMVIDEQVVNVPLVNLWLNYGMSYSCKILDNNNPADCGSNIFYFDVLCDGDDVCSNFSNLYSCNVTCYLGYYENPFMTIASVLHTNANNSRHKVNRDTSEHDQIISALRVIPPGEIVSVRLGNCNSGGEAESVKYHYLVDTSVYDMLILKYAAVLEDPNHEPCDQPRFTIDIFDELGDTISPECYSRNYVANSSLGWNQMRVGLLWKDWTTVGINLDELHGQWIDIRLTTYDCARTGHYGYAYYTLNCMNKVVRSETCGAMVANTFTAPDGFEYEWYNTNSPSTILGREQTLSVSSAGTYKCRLRMIDAPMGNCETEMTAYAGTRYPYARFEYEHAMNECETAVQFYDRSVISKNQSHTQLLDIQCDDVWWDFGDGFTSSERNPRHEYNLMGTYEVTMVASLAEGTCTDTIRQTIRVGLDCSTILLYDTICFGYSLEFFDTVLTTEGVYKHVTENTTTWMALTVEEPPTVYYSETILENQLPWTYRGNVYHDSTIDTIIWSYSDRCDSVCIYMLYVCYNEVRDSVKIVCEDKMPIVWHGVTFDSAGTDSVVYAGAGRDGVDVKIRMTVVVEEESYKVYADTVVENQLPYNYHGFSFDTIVDDTILIVPMGERCDSVINYSLMVYYNETDTIMKSICEDELPYTWVGQVFDEAGTRRVNLRNCHGADSVVTLVLTVFPSYEVEVADSICNGDVYHLGDMECTLAGDYQNMLTSMMGCDSLVTVHLSIKEDKYTQEHLRLCKGSSVTWQDGNTYAEPTAEPIVVFEASNGCDSVVQLLLDTTLLEARFHVSPRYVTYENPEIQLDDESVGNNRRMWYLPNMISDVASWEYHYPLMEDSIKVLMVAMDEFNCEDSVSVWVYKHAGQIWIPNVFTPGEDENNVFRVVGEDLLDIEVLIYDRRGQFIYHYNTLDGYWDGMMNGTVCPQAAYVYKVIYHTKAYPERTQSAVGTVLLLR